MPERPRRLSLIVNSVLAATLGLLVAHLVDLVGLVVAGAFAGTEPTLYHDRVAFGADGSDLALGGGVAADLLVGFGLLSIYPGGHRHNAARLGVLWLILHCFRMGLFQLVTVPFLPESVTARAFSALDVAEGVEWVIAGVGALGLLTIALASAPAFLAYALHRRDIDTSRKRLAFAAQIALVPALLAPVLAFPFIFDLGSEVPMTLVLSGAFVVGTLLAAPGTVRGPAQAEEHQFGWGLLVWLVAVFVAMRFGLARGLPLANLF